MTLTRRGKVVRALVVLVVVLLLVIVAGVVWLDRIGVWGDSEPGHEVTIVIPKGATAADVGELLEARDVIPSALGWRIEMLMNGSGSQIEAGRYQLRTGLTAGDALTALTSHGPLSANFVTVTFPEGSTLEQFSTIVAKHTKISSKAFLHVSTSGKVRSRYEPKNVKTLEGLVFPSTYQVIGRDTATTLATRLVDTFDKTFGGLDDSELATVQVTDYQAIIVASMVEEEAKVDADRGKIARVIYNRLEKGMPLGIDATIEYVLDKHAGELTQSDLEIDSPYNTRLHPGLPPTPIAAAGKASLEAALHPTPGRWLYYVVKDCAGHHAFSTSYDHFLADKAHYQSLNC